LEGLSPDEARAVLAHELAHLSRRHGRTGRWIYYLRRSWENAFEQLSKTRGHRQAPLQSRILELVNWFWPRFNAHAFVLSRTNEYEADAVSVRLTSRGPALYRSRRVGVNGRECQTSNSASNMRPARYRRPPATTLRSGAHRCPPPN